MDKKRAISGNVRQWAIIFLSALIILLIAFLIWKDGITGRQGEEPPPTSPPQSPTPEPTPTPEPSPTPTPTPTSTPTPTPTPEPTPTPAPQISGGGGGDAADRTPPSITLILPEDNKITTETTITFSYKAKDNNVISECSLIIDNDVVSTNSSIKDSDFESQFVHTFNVSNSYTWQVNCVDKYNNIGNSNRRNLTINISTPIKSQYSSTLSNPLETMPGGGNKYTLTSEEFSDGREIQKISENDKIEFNVDGQSHKIIVDNVTTDSVTITVTSEEQTIILAVGGEKKFELTGDDYYDLLVTVKSIEENKTNLIIKEIHEMISVPESTLTPSPTPELTPTPAPRPEKASPIQSIVIIIVFVVLVFVLFYLIKRIIKIAQLSKKQKRKMTKKLRKR